MEKVREDVTTVQRMTRVCGLVKTNRTHHQPGSMKFSRTRDMKFGFNEGVRSERADQPGY
jgi:hypothetical protein